MTEEEKLPKALAETLGWLKKKPCIWLSAREVGEGMGISYSAAYYRLRELARREYIRTYVSWIVRPRIRRRWFHYIPPPVFYKSHIIVSVVYETERKMFEIHEIINHLEPEPPKEVAIRLAISLLLDYFAVEGIEESSFLRKCEFVYGEVQTAGVRKLNKTTHAIIIDIQASGKPVRRCYEIKWYIEVTLEGERKLRIESFKEVPIKSEKELKEEWEKLAKEES